tara:strand:+ start:170 stop:331 length:162 start_codon:yes stop_codon:yes gene_type:complete
MHDLQQAIAELEKIINHPINLTYGYDIDAIIDELSIEYGVNKKDLIDHYDSIT